MESLVIEATRHTPLVDFKSNGTLKMEGRALPEDVNKLFTPLVDFVNNLEVHDAVFDINLDYFNTATSKSLLNLMKHLDANNRVGNVLINWYYEEGDDDSLEIAEIFEDCLMRTEFRYHEFEEGL